MRLLTREYHGCGSNRLAPAPKGFQRYEGCCVSCGPFLPYHMLSAAIPSGRWRGYRIHIVHGGGTLACRASSEAAIDTLKTRLLDGNSSNAVICPSLVSATP